MNLPSSTNAPAAPDGANDNAGAAFGKDISAGIFKNYLVYLFLLGLIVRAGFMVEHARTPSFGVLTLDQKYYDTAARMLLAGADLHQLHGLRPLLYPMFLAVLYKLGGSHGIDLAVVVQHLLGVLTGVLAALLGARLFRHRLSGLAGGVLFLLAPVPLCFEGELLIEPSYVFLICLGLLLLLHAADAAGRKGRPVVAAVRRLDRAHRAGAPEPFRFHGGVSAPGGLALVALASTRRAVAFIGVDRRGGNGHPLGFCQ